MGWLFHLDARKNMDIETEKQLICHLTPNTCSCHWPFLGQVSLKAEYTWESKGILVNPVVLLSIATSAFVFVTLLHVKCKWTKLLLFGPGIYTLSYAAWKRFHNWVWTWIPALERQRWEPDFGPLSICKQAAWKTLWALACWEGHLGTMFICCF